MGLPSPDPGDLDVAFTAWAQYRPLRRVCRLEYPANAFNPSDSPGRFRPIYEGGGIVSTMYASDQLDGAFGETIFHDIPASGGPWHIPREALYGTASTTLIPLRQLRLVDLTGWAHKRLRLEGRALADAPPLDYPVTAEWCARFRSLDEEPDGLLWASRQFDRAVALILFGDRVGADDLHPVLDETVGLWQGLGLAVLEDAAARAGIVIDR